MFRKELMHLQTKHTYAVIVCRFNLDFLIFDIRCGGRTREGIRKRSQMGLFEL